MRKNTFGPTPIPNIDERQTNIVPSTYEPFLWKGKFWDVPEDFEFPSQTKQWIGYNLWVKSIPSNIIKRNGIDISMTIKKFRLFNTQSLPKKIANTFKLNWRPLLSIMEEDISILKPSLITSSVLKDIFNRENLKKRANYVFINNKLKEDKRRVSTWCKYLKWIMIEKN